MRQPDGRRSGVRAHRPGRKIPGAASHRAEDRVLLHGAGTARTPARVLRRQDGARAQVILCARSGLASPACTDLLAAFSMGAKASATTTWTCANTCSAWWATPSHRRGSRPSTGPGPTGGAPFQKQPLVQMDRRPKGLHGRPGSTNWHAIVCGPTATRLPTHGAIRCAQDPMSSISLAIEFDPLVLRRYTPLAAEPQPCSPCFPHHWTTCANCCHSRNRTDSSLSKASTPARQAFTPKKGLRRRSSSPAKRQTETQGTNTSSATHWDLSWVGSISLGCGEHTFTAPNLGTVLVSPQPAKAMPARLCAKYSTKLSVRSAS